MYPTIELFRLMVEEIGARSGAVSDEHGTGHSVGGERTGTGMRATLPELVERAGGAARFAWEEYFYVEHHNPHTQRAYLRAVQGVPGLGRGAGGGAGGDHAGHGRPVPRRPGRVARQAESGPGGVTRLLRPAGERHVVILNPAASVRGVKDQVIEGKTPEITIEQARTLLRSVKVGRPVEGGSGCVTGRLSPRSPIPPAGPVRWPSCGWGIQDDGTQYVLRFQEKGGKSREIPVRHDLEGFIRAYVEAAGIAAKQRSRRCSGRRTGGADSCGEADEPSG